jgi:hypothetical protein
MRTLIKVTLALILLISSSVGALAVQRLVLVELFTNAN